MVYIAKKIIKGHTYYYLMESKRIKGKVKTKTIKYLGKSKKLAQEKLKDLQKPKLKQKIKVLKEPNKAEKIINIAIKRGFFYPTAEIYGSKAGFWTYGHLGCLMKNKFEQIWRNYFLKLDDNYFEIHGSCILPKKVFESSGHLEHFKDPLIECKRCNFRFRADEFIENKLKINVEGLTDEAMTKLIKDNKLKCPNCSSLKLGTVKWFNMMFDVKIGATGDNIAYLSPESAQNPYLSFKREFLALREKFPLGLAMIGKVFRNEISPRQGFFRLREFTQAELQIFFNPEKINEAKNWGSIKNYKLKLFLVKDRKTNTITEITCEKANKNLKLPKFYIYHLAKIQQFYLNILKIPKEKFRFKELSKQEKAFYNKIHFDIEIYFEISNGFKEIGGLHYRTDHDLKAHQKGSQEKLEVLINNKKIIPHVLEISFGVDRNILALLDVFYKKELVKGEERNLFVFPPVIAPFELAIFPLVNKNKLPEKSIEIYNLLKDNFTTFYDNKSSIGRRYRRMDEIGCSLAITIDFQTLKDNTVTIRDLLTMKQIRVKIKDLQEKIRKILDGKLSFKKAGKLIN